MEPTTYWGGLVEGHSKLMAERKRLDSGETVRMLAADDTALTNRRVPRPARERPGNPDAGWGRPARNRPHVLPFLALAGLAAVLLLLLSLRGGD